MLRLCCECEKNIGNPFYSLIIFALDKQKNRIAYSDFGMKLCEEEIDKVISDLQNNPERLESVVGFAIEGVTGVVKNVGTMQFDLSESHMDYRYLDIRVALQKLPKSTQRLIRSPCGFREYDDTIAEWKEASWAIDICNRELQA